MYESPTETTQSPGAAAPTGGSATGPGGACAPAAVANETPITAVSRLSVAAIASGRRREERVMPSRVTTKFRNSTGPFDPVRGRVGRAPGQPEYSDMTPSA